MTAAAPACFPAPGVARPSPDLAAGLTVAELLAAGLALPPPAGVEPVPPGTVCAATGAPIREGVPRRQVTTGATAEFLDHFRADVHGWVSPAAAACYQSASPRLGNPCARAFLAFPDALYLPFIARESAQAQGETEFPWGARVPRPCWSELVREVWPGRRGEPCALLLTTDVKKRVWPGVAVGPLGAATPVYLYDGPHRGRRRLDWPALLALLDLLEAAYGRGWSKESLDRSLPAGCPRGVSLAEAFRREGDLAPWRTRPEWAVALLIAQRPPEGSPLLAAPPDSPPPPAPVRVPPPTLPPARVPQGVLTFDD